LVREAEALNAPASVLDELLSIEGSLPVDTSDRPEGWAESQSSGDGWEVRTPPTDDEALDAEADAAAEASAK
jgi:hypothetical protein